MEAELFGKLIYFSLSQVGARSMIFNGGLDEVSQAVANHSSDEPGIYSLWMSTAFSLDKFVPTYLGYTSRTFRTRLTEHARTGRIREMYTGLPAKTAGGIGVVYVPMNEVTARAIEAVFLRAFNFAQNAADNTSSRPLVFSAWSETNLNEEPSLPESAGDIEAFNHIVEAFQEQRDATAALYQHYAQLKH